LAETGRAVAQLTINQLRFEDGSASESDFVSEISSGLKLFHNEKSTKSKKKEDHSTQLPKVFRPKFNGQNPVIWKDKCIDYFMLVYLEPKHWVRMAAIHFEGSAAQWLRVYRKKVPNPTWLQLVLAVEEKFGKDDYRKALTELLELKQTGLVDKYFYEFQELQFQLCMHNERYDDLFFASQFVNGLKEDLKYTVQAQVPDIIERAVSLAKIQQKIVEGEKGN
jgi:hypothetical protein